MKSIQTLLVLLFGISSQISFGQFTDEINSNRPGKSMMAFAVGKTIIQTETGVTYVSEDHNLLDYQAKKGFMGELAIRYGVWKEELEIIGEIQYQNDKLTSGSYEESRNGFKQLTLGAKYLIYDPLKTLKTSLICTVGKPIIASNGDNLFRLLLCMLGLILKVGDNPFSYAPSDIIEPSFSPKVTAIAQNHFGGRWVLVTNLTYDKIGTDFATINYILTLTRGFNAQWSGFIENQGYMGDYYSDGVMRIGAAFCLTNTCK